ncbi:MAG: class I SAM-dependent methyltransferase [Formosimonas sp.]
MDYQGLHCEASNDVPHLGGNISMGDPFTHAPSVWDYLIKRFALKSVLDLGCGMAYSSDYFYRQGLKVIAVDGFPDNIKKSVYPSIQQDLTISPVVCHVDLVHCQEVVEHIEERYLENLLQSMACGKVIVMTNALPGQGGYHHVNEQPTEYWMAHLARYNYEVLHEDTMRVRRLAAQDGATYLAHTGLVLANHSKI